MERAPFEAPTVPHLETYVQAQLLAQQPFHMASCHLLLKNYQVHTKLCKPEYVANVLVLALMRLPSPDFLSLSYMIPCTVADHPQIVCVRNCANYLERAKFKEFWIEYSSAPQSLFSAAFGFVGAIRSYILSCLANTFKNIPQALFLELLGLPQVEINAFIAAAPRALQVCRFVCLVWRTY